ncbi:hypothetical protein B0H17DRAFT_1144266 [Mycena rosella]|uniref:Alpha-type protein kinase domain-containing protein n=1 Tax=Mycena rosella TaxID=1033263 RepID=A0AAD7CU94_MYCRO|nr:hypothetical protein B0H17DRAFT_1144266 [Mycena rosella]
MFLFSFPSTISTGPTIESTHRPWLLSLFLETILYGAGALQTGCFETTQITFFYQSTDLRFVERFGKLWRNSNGIAEFTSENSDTYSDIFGSSGKRKATTQANYASKRIALTPAGAGAYRTSIQINQLHHTVSRIDCTINDTGAVFTEDSSPLYVSVRLESSASGMTKNMFILTLDGVQYAAKCFFDIGGHAPTPEENLSHLKDELACQKQVTRCLARFQARAAEHKISIAGPQKHLAWIVDPLLSTFQTVKFSGTDIAGSHGDLFGATCDALAHFSLEDSEQYLVFLDIQGIKQPKYVHGVRGSDELVLFDLMAHTTDGLTNLGDKGTAGLGAFKSHIPATTFARKFPFVRLPMKERISAARASSPVRVTMGHAIQAATTALIRSKPAIFFATPVAQRSHFRLNMRSRIKQVLGHFIDHPKCPWFLSIWCTINCTQGCLESPELSHLTGAVDGARNRVQSQCDTSRSLGTLKPNSPDVESSFRVGCDQFH